MNIYLVMVKCRQTQLACLSSLSKIPPLRQLSAKHVFCLFFSRLSKLCLGLYLMRLIGMANNCTFVLPNHCQFSWLSSNNARTCLVSSFTRVQKLLESNFSSLAGHPELRHIDQTTLKHCHTAATTFILEGVKQNADKSTIR